MPAMPILGTVDPAELFLRPDPSRGARPLEMFVRLSDDASHFYAQGISLGEFCTLYARDLRGHDVLIYRMPAELLNPNYWEPLTKEGEGAVREKLQGIVTRTDGDRTLLWRADRLPKGRLLRDGLDPGAPVELLQGYVFRTTPEGLARLAEAWNGRDRFEWAAVKGLPQDGVSPDALSKIHAGITQGCLAFFGTTFLYLAQGDGLTRILFAERALLHRAVEAILRGFLTGALGTHIGRFSHKVCDQLTRLCDGMGFSATARDIVDKGRSLDIYLHLGRTPWGAAPSGDREVLLSGEKILLYYDVVAGLWGVTG
jgi:hypothetical protein